ncbi:MAG: hypothetical protein ACRYF8_10490 [Janthinobacterium lividum]
MSNDLAGSVRFGPSPDVPRKMIEALRLNDSLNKMALKYLTLIESAQSETLLAYVHGRAEGHVEGLDEARALTGQQGIYLQNAFQSAKDKRLAQLR